MKHSSQKFNKKQALKHCLDRCREAHLRRTKILIWLLEEMVAEENPITLASLQDKAKTRGQECDPTTLYRQIMKLEAIGLVRRLGFHQRSNFFKLNLPNQHQDYLICGQCGIVRTIEMECPVHAIETAVSEESGFADVHHELEFFGTCPKCQTNNS